MSGIVKVYTKVRRSLVTAIEDAVRLGRYRWRCRVARGRLWLRLELLLDYGGALAVAHRDFVQSRCLGVGIFSLVQRLLQLLCDLLAQECRVGTFVLGQRGQLAIERGELVDLLDSIAVVGIEVADERQGAHSTLR